MVTQEEFIKRYESEKNIYFAWGNFVKSEIICKLAQLVNINEFIKIDFPPRIKKIDSLIEKAFFREGKNYEDPYNDITDKVGIRFVVLLLTDIKKICNIVEEIDIWHSSKDRDFENEREKDPFRFGYESVHYVVRNKRDMEINGVSVPAATPCEIQVRTLLQHAYSELTHDTIYKPRTRVVSSIKRIAARSMALIETTDELFKEVNEVIQREEENYTNLLPQLCDIYSQIVKLDFEKKINLLILDSYKELLINISADEVNEFVEKNSYLKNRIKLNYDKSLIHRQPIILLLYYLVDSMPYKTKDIWPLTREELEPIFEDMGESLPI